MAAANSTQIPARPVLSSQDLPFRASSFRTQSTQTDAGLKATHDPRAERTRSAIFAAIRELMTERAASVSVADIVRIAGISRSSFYAHFAGLDELAAELLRTQFADIGPDSLDVKVVDRVDGREAARHGYAQLVAHMVENFPLYSSVLDLPLTRSAYDHIVEAHANRLLRSVLVLDRVPAAMKPDVAISYLAGGALTLISAWMRGHLDVSDDELVEHLVGLLPAWLTD
jgi:AcrR family transcriptional regulator